MNPWRCINSNTWAYRCPAPSQTWSTHRVLTAQEISFRRFKRRFGLRRRRRWTWRGISVPLWSKMTTSDRPNCLSRKQTQQFNPNSKSANPKKVPNLRQVFRKPISSFRVQRWYLIHVPHHCTSCQTWIARRAAAIIFWAPITVTPNLEQRWPKVTRKRASHNTPKTTSQFCTRWRNWLKTIIWYSAEIIKIMLRLHTKARASSSQTPSSSAPQTKRRAFSIWALRDRRCSRFYRIHCRMNSTSAATNRYTVASSIPRKIFVRWIMLLRRYVSKQTPQPPRTVPSTTAAATPPLLHPRFQQL